MGPQWVTPVLLDKENGIVSYTDLFAETILNYSFHIGVHTYPSKFQAGLELIQDRKKFNLYYLLQWPQTGSSHWDHSYVSYRVGLGANVRYHFGQFYLQAAGSYMNEISSESESVFHEPGAPSDYYDGEYTTNSGWLLSAGIGYAWTNDGRLSSLLSFGYDTAEHEFNDEQFSQYWKVRNNIIGFTVNYQLNKNP